MKEKKGWIGALISLFAGPFGYLYFGWRPFVVSLLLSLPIYSTILLPFVGIAMFINTGRQPATTQFGPYGEGGQVLYGIYIGLAVIIALSSILLLHTLLAGYGFRVSGIQKRLRRSEAMPSRQNKKPPQITAALVVFIELFLSITAACSPFAALIVFRYVQVDQPIIIWLLLVCAALFLLFSVWFGLLFLFRRISGVDFMPFAKALMPKGSPEPAVEQNTI